MGVAFAAGVVAVAIRRRRRPHGRGVLDGIAVVASVAVPLAMTALPSADGLLQRLMFAIAYAWYGTEALRGARPGPADGGSRETARRRPRRLGALACGGWSTW
jgi:hypothetical protein